MSPSAARLPLLLTLAWRNLWRHKRRTLVMLFALVLGIWSMIVMAALIRGSMEQQVEKEILNLTGHVQIHAPGYRDDPAVEHRFAVTPALAEALRAKAVVAAGARVRVPAVISSERESAGVVLVGIDPQGERGLSFISTGRHRRRVPVRAGRSGLAARPQAGRTARNRARAARGADEPGRQQPDRRSGFPRGRHLRCRPAGAGDRLCIRWARHCPADAQDRQGCLRGRGDDAGPQAAGGRSWRRCARPRPARMSPRGPRWSRWWC